MTDSRISQMVSSLDAAAGVVADVMAQLSLLKDEDPSFALPVSTAVTRAEKALAGAWDQADAALTQLRIADRLENSYSELSRVEFPWTGA